MDTPRSQTKFPTTPLTTASIFDLGWFVGSWHGERGEEQLDEHWALPLGNAMIGMFRWIRAGQIYLFEFMSIEYDGEQIIFRIKHFGQNLVGWEEKQEAVTFVLVALIEGDAIFAKRNAEKPLWMIYRRLDENNYTSFFDHADEEHKPEDEFRFTRQSPG